MLQREQQDVMNESIMKYMWVLVGKPEGTRPLGRPRHRWEDNIKLDFRDRMMRWHELN
jgi:hypothetical protein